MLSPSQIDEYRDCGFLVVPGAVTADQLARLRSQMAAWLEESRAHKRSYGTTADNRPRFDLDGTHTSERPALRRINNPIEVSEAFFEVMADSAMTDMVADLIGPDVKLHHSKINIKAPGSPLDVKFHQDFTATPHTNPDLVSACLMLDDSTLENGCLTIVPGSHREGLISVWRDGKYVAMVADDVQVRCLERALPAVGAAGSVCLMSTLALHGSAANRSGRPRGLLICVYAAADAIPIAPSPVLSAFEGRIVRGKPTRMARLVDLRVELPGDYGGASFFDAQAGVAAPRA